MITHIKVIAILHIVFGALGILGALALLAIFGGIAGMAGISDQTPDARLAAPVLGGLGLVLCIFILALSLPGLIVGIGLMRLAPWSRIAGIVLSAIDFINVPFGTALGVYGLWALTQRETEQLFASSTTRTI